MLASTEIELSYAAYQQRQHREISQDGLAFRAARLEPGGKFRFHAGTWMPEPYVGHAVVSMLDQDPANAPLAARLASIQNELSYNLADPSALYLLPTESFHQTIANTLSAEKHQRFVVERGLAGEYPAHVTSAFADLPPAPAQTPLSMRMIGLSLFSTAIGMLGVFDTEDDFQRVLHFREHFYGHERIGMLGIRRTRPFIGHITLAYIESLLDEAARSRLVEVAASINRLLADGDLRFHLPFAELRAYAHLAEFKPLRSLPVQKL